MDDTPRHVLNAHLNLTNIIEEDSIREIMLDTFTKLKELLLNHCGPYGKFAMLNDTSNPRANPIFTKDGINIIRAVEFASPMQTMVKRTVAYIGSRIETAAADGTTSAMIIAISALEHLLITFNSARPDQQIRPMIDTFIGPDIGKELFSEVTADNLRNFKVSQAKLTEIYSEFVADIESRLECAKYTLDGLTDTLSHRLTHSTEHIRKALIKYIAYHQACVSSHNDLELSKAVAEMFTIIPESAWGHVFFQREKFETKDRIKAIVDRNQYSLPATLMQQNMLNINMNTKLFYEHATLIVLGCNLSEGDMLRWNPVYAAMERAVQNNTPLVVLTPGNMCGITRDTIQTFRQTHPCNKIAFLAHQTSQPKMNDLLGIKLVAGHDPSDEDTGKVDIIEDVTVAYDNQTLQLNNLYANPDNVLIHPLVGSKEFPVMDIVLEMMQKTIEVLKNDDRNPTTQEQMLDLQRLYNKIHLTSRATIKIGGSIHDNAAALDVVMDTIGAVQHSLSKGFVLGGNRSLQQALTDMIFDDCHQNGSLSVENYQLFTARLLKLIFAVTFIAAIKDMVKGIIRHAPPATAHNLTTLDLIHSVDIISGLPGIVPDVLMKAIKEDLPLEAIPFPLIIQPSTIDGQILSRFGDVGLKFINTVRIMSPGGVYCVPEKEAKKTSWLARFMRVKRS